MAIPSRIELDRAICERSFEQFVKRAWHVLESGTELKWGWALSAICEHLEAVHYGKIKKLLINVPPGCSKSLLVGVFFPAWEWGARKSPHLRYLGTAHKATLAIRDSMKCRRLISSEWYQERWETILTGDQNAKTKFENVQGGFREAMAFSSLTGSRGDRLLIDDPVSVDSGNSQAALESAKTTFLESVPTRLNNQDESATIVIMQRVHENDTSGVILSRKLDYDHLMLPMRFEKERKCTTSIGFTDPRTEYGELIFPELFSEEATRSLEKTMGSYAAAGQLQQRPAPRDGGLFKRHWFNVVNAIPAGTKFVRGWDLAATEGAGDYTVGAKVGRTPEGRYIICHIARGQLSPAGVDRLLLNTSSQDGQSVKISIPQDPGAAGVAQKLYFAKLLAGYSFKFSTETGDKEVRARPLSAQAEAGNVDLLAGDWNELYLDELCVFPSGSNDDQVDATSRAFNELSAKRRGLYS